MGSELIPAPLPSAESLRPHYHSFDRNATTDKKGEEGGSDEFRPCVWLQKSAKLPSPTRNVDYLSTVKFYISYLILWPFPSVLFPFALSRLPSLTQAAGILTVAYIISRLRNYAKAP